MVKGIWNYAIKAHDVEAVANFYCAHFDAKVLRRREMSGTKDILVKMGVTRVLIFEKAPYEDELGLNLPEGFLHDVYEVDDFDIYYARLQAAGVKLLTEPKVIETDFDRRKLVFIETPTGIRTEVMQVLEHKKDA